MTLDKLNIIYCNFISKNNLECVDCETLLYWGQINQSQKDWLQRFKNIWVKVINKK